jgi:hypothetical protein
MQLDPLDLTWRQVHWPLPLDAGAALGLLERLAADVLRDPVIWEARSHEGSVVYMVGTAAHQVRVLMDLLDGMIPGVAHAKPSFDRVSPSAAARMRMRQNFLPLERTSAEQSARTVLAALAAAHFRGEQAVVQIVLGRGSPGGVLPPRPYDPTQSWFDALVSGTRAAPPDLAARMRRKREAPGFSATVRIGAAAASDGRKLAILRGMTAALRTFQSPGMRIEFLRDAPDELGSARVPRRLPLRLACEDVLRLLAWPLDVRGLPGLPAAHPLLLAGPASLDGSRAFASTSAPGERRPVGISGSDALFHTLFLGPSGVGKSTAMLNLISADMKAGRSVVVIDPKADLVRDVLARVPEERRGDVVVLDPTSDRPVGLNPVRAVGTPPELVADNILGIFRDLFPAQFGPNVADALHASLLTLTHSPGATLAWLPRLFSDAAFRSQLVGALDPALGLDAFWAQYGAMSERQQSQFVGPVLSRLRQLLLRPGLRRVLDQPEPKFELRDLMTGPRILLVPLNSGLIGADASRLLGSLLVTQLWQLTLARAADEQTKRTPVSLYVDEVQEYLRLGGSELADALSRSRSLGVGWHLAHQFRTQLRKELLGAVDSNVRNVVAFSLDSGDAAAFAKKAPALTPEDFMSLPPYAVYANLMSDGAQTGWFSAVTLAAPPEISDTVELLSLSRERYGVDPAEPAPSSASEREVAPPDSPIRRRKRRTE